MVSELAAGLHGCHMSRTKQTIVQQLEFVQQVEGTSVYREDGIHDMVLRGRKSSIEIS